MSRALIIRQREEAIPLAASLREKGVVPYICPLFKPRFLALPPLETPQALIVTSKNALRSLRERVKFHTLPLYTVGDKTAEFARALGFLNVLSASGDSKDLCHLILQKASPSKGALLYLSGDVVKGNITENLTTAGFVVKRHIVYTLESREDFPSSLKRALTQGNISYVLFFSPHTTTLFLHLLKKEKLEALTEKMTSLCLSQDVVKKVLDVKWKKVWVSPHPTVEALMDYFHAK